MGIAGIPSEAQTMFNELYASASESMEGLDDDINKYLGQVQEKAGGSDVIDVVLAGAVANGCQKLVKWATGHGNGRQRKAVYAAVQYFILEDDASPDSGPDGYLDDAEVVNAVAFYVGKGDIRVVF